MITRKLTFLFFSIFLISTSITNAQIEDSAVYVQLSKNFAAKKMSGISITSIQHINAGDFSPPNSTTPQKKLPAFCRITAMLKPTPGSDIRIEVWLPANNWNGRFLGTGNGGGAGNIAYTPLAGGVRRGFATANTDMGTSPNVNTTVGQPEKWVDFGYRATHEMTLVAKVIIETFYRKQAGYSYFAGCSTGGQQALMEAQRYPGDYNGILAGAPANNRTHLHTDFLWNYKVTNQFPGSAFLPLTKLKLITSYVVKSCAGKDGGAAGDNFLTDPDRCRFDPSIIPVCAEAQDSDSCLTPAQLTALKKIYDGPVNPRTGERIYTAIPLGSENSASGIVLQQNPQALPQALLYPFKWAFGNEFDYTKFDFDKDMDKVDSMLAGIVNANNPDLKPLQKLNGKILMYSGTADPIVPYQDAVNYYERVVKDQKSLEKTQNFFRFFIVPGMAHCGGGPGLNDCGQSLSLDGTLDNEHDMMTALIKWVEEGKAPEKFIASAVRQDSTRKEILFQRPIYPYPKFPDYEKGDANNPSSYIAAEHKRGVEQTPAARYLR